MKLIRCDGRELTVRDAGPILMVVRAAAMPLKHNGWRLMEDDAARDLLRELLASGLYEHQRLV